MTCFGSLDALNASFLVVRPTLPLRSASEDMGKLRGVDGPSNGTDMVMSPLDAKTLLLGDVAENGSWWTGHRTDGRSPSLPLRKETRSQTKEWGYVNYKTPRIDWVKLGQWYQTIIKAGQGWKSRWQASLGEDVRADEVAGHLRRMEEDIEQARLRLQRTLLHATENLLKRPGRPLKTPQDMRFLLLFLANPLLYPSTAPSPRPQPRRRSPDPRVSPSSDAGASRPFPAIVKRITGLLAHLPNECHHILVSWFSRLSEHRFRRMVELVGGFVTYRLSRPHKRQRSDTVDPTAGLIPEFSGAGVQSSARLHAALGITSTDTADDKPKPAAYGSDWQLRAAAKVMALLFTANNSGAVKRDPSESTGRLPGQIVPTSEFYISLLDYSDLVADFEAWELRRGGFSFCQYPFFLSIGAKIRVLQYDARRQMELKAREAFFDSILGRKVVNQHLVLRVRRDCLVDDSLRAVSEVVGAGQEEIKKGLRIDFIGEEGVDAGGLRKEWFLLLVRDIFDPQHGLFVYDDDSRYCYFNPYCFETSDQFFLVGVLLGLAIYNSTILDIALPPFAFKKLLAAAPSTPNNVPRSTLHLTLDDLADYRPSLAHGLRQLLAYEGDVESTFSLDFVVDTDRYGQVVRVPLCPNGENKPITNANRREYVDLYVHYLLDTAVMRQFEPFKRGFYTVCGGNALSLFRAEEIELLVRGSDERLNVESLKGVAAYGDWGDPNHTSTSGGGGGNGNRANITNGVNSNTKSDPAETEQVIQWFWSFLDRLDPASQRKVLGFITGSDRIPALGATHLTIRLVCLGEDCDRFPVARTCFNALCLYRYRTREKLERMLWRAVEESEGFGLK